jgi:hypothetical protein
MIANVAAIMAFFMQNGGNAACLPKLLALIQGNYPHFFVKI